MRLHYLFTAWAASSYGSLYRMPAIYFIVRDNLNWDAVVNAPFNEVSLRSDFPSTAGEAAAREPASPGASAPGMWAAMRVEAAREYGAEPYLAPLFASILEHRTFEEALVSILSIKLGHSSLPAEALGSALLGAVLADPSIGEAARADIVAVLERDPASGSPLEPFLFFKGYAAIQTHRLAHWLWKAGRRNLALYLQSRSSEVFQTDIHPGAQIGKGVLLDHATGFVAGETVVIEDNVSILHGVTLGGTGIEKGGRHPKVRTGVLIGSGVQIIGDIEIGAYSKIAAGSFVTQNVPSHCTAVGVPARIIEGAGSNNPAQTMDQSLAQGSYKFFDYII